jgi:D-glycero-D-manno-heptose 1,7-bisphosphate phosphatase
MGARLGTLTKNLPKPILPVAGRPFLHYVLWALENQGVKKIVVSAGYKADVIKSTLDDIHDFSLEVHHVTESSPLGTGGGARFAAEILDDGPFFVLNGDTIFDVPLSDLAALKDNNESMSAMALRCVNDVARYGAVRIDGNTVISMDEKTERGEGLINGGIYLLDKNTLFSHLPSGASSIERDLLPGLIKNKSLIGLPYRGFFIDIGVPETYEAAQTILPRWKNNRNRPFLLLDRDGTIIAEKNYLSDPNQVEIIPGVIEGLLSLQEKGFGFVVISNQSGIGRGYYGEEDTRAVNDRMIALLSQYGITIDGIFFCPHSPEERCLCRKPRPGMVYQAIDNLGFSLEHTAIIGDKACDIELGKPLGIRTILVKSGYGAGQAASLSNAADYIAESIDDAAKWLSRKHF